MEFPTRGGIPIPVEEVYLPESRLDLDHRGNLENHHNIWTRREAGRLAITQTLRDLSRHQYVIPSDVHRSLHRLYGPPGMPRLDRAMDEIDEAYHNGEHMRVYLIDQKRYVEWPISEIHMKTLQAEYNALNS